jgi:hypothetical protein
MKEQHQLQLDKQLKENMRRVKLSQNIKENSKQ